MRAMLVGLLLFGAICFAPTIVTAQAVPLAVFTDPPAASALSGGAGAIVDWFKGSGLRPFLAPLDGDERADFLARYQSAVARAYPAATDGSVLLPFPRLFMVALV